MLCSSPDQRSWWSSSRLALLIGSFYVPSSLFVSTSRMVGIESNCPLFIFSVYRSGCTVVFKEAVDQLETAILLFPPGADVIVKGDFNADLGHLGEPMSCTQLNEQGKILHRYLTKWSFVSTHLHLQPNVSSYTYKSDTYSTQSIDHIFCPLGMLPKFISASTITEEPLNTSDHNPVLAVVYHSLSHSPSIPPTSSQSHLFNPRNWAGTSKEDIRQLYTEPLQQSLELLFHELPSLLLNPSLIDQYFHLLSSLLLSSSAHIPPKSFFPHRSPGYSTTLKAMYTESKRLYRAWVVAGIPRDPDHPVRRA